MHESVGPNFKLGTGRNRLVEAVSGVAEALPAPVGALAHQAGDAAPRDGLRGRGGRERWAI